MEAEIAREVVIWILRVVFVAMVVGGIFLTLEAINAPLMDEHGHYVDEAGHVISKEESRKIKHPLTHRRGEIRQDLRAEVRKQPQKGSSTWGRGG